VLFSQIIDTPYMFSWNNQKMYRSHRINIFKNNEGIVFIQEFGRHLAVYNLTKNAVFFHTGYPHLKILITKTGYQLKAGHFVISINYVGCILCTVDGA